MLKKAYFGKCNIAWNRLIATMLLKYSLQNSQLDNERLPNLTRTKLHNLHLAHHTSKNTECTSRDKISNKWHAINVGTHQAKTARRASNIYAERNSPDFVWNTQARIKFYGRVFACFCSVSLSSCPRICKSYLKCTCRFRRFDRFVFNFLYISGRKFFIENLRL